MFIQKDYFSFFSKEEINSINIPAYQRNYVWDAENIEELVGDLLENSTSKDDYFLGNSVLRKTKKDALFYNIEIIDGQQRLLTLSLIMILFKKYILINQLNDKYSSELILIKNFTEKIKFTDPSQNKKYKKILEYGDSFDTGRSLKDWNFIVKVFKSLFSSKNIKDIFILKNEDKIFDIYKQITKKIYLCFIYLEENESEYLFFEKTNTNRKVLNEWNLVKNILIEEFGDDHDKNKKIVEFENNLKEEFSNSITNNDLNILKSDSKSISLKMNSDGILFRNYLERSLCGSNTFTKKTRYREYKKIFTKDKELFFDKILNSVEFNSDKKDDNYKILQFFLSISIKLKFDNFSPWIMTIMNQWDDIDDKSSVLGILKSILISQVTNLITGEILPEKMKGYIFSIFKELVIDNQIKWNDNAKNVMSEIWKNNFSGTYDTYDINKFKTKKDTINYIYRILSKVDFSSKWIDSIGEKNLNTLTDEHFLHQKIKTYSNNAFNFDWSRINKNDKKEYRENYKMFGNIFHITQKNQNEIENLKMEGFKKLKENIFKSSSKYFTSNEKEVFKSFDCWGHNEIILMGNKKYKFMWDVLKELSKEI